MGYFVPSTIASHIIDSKQTSMFVFICDGDHFLIRIVLKLEFFFLDCVNYKMWIIDNVLLLQRIFLPK